MTQIINCNFCISGNCALCVNASCLCRKSHSKRELINEFTKTAASVLPSSIDELKQILHNEPADVPDDSIPEEIINEGISKSIDRYFDVIGNGDFASLNEGGYTIPGNGGFYESCMKLGVKGCIGSAPDYEDELSSSVHEKYRRKLHNDFDSEYNEGRKTINGQKIRMTCRRLSCSKCFRKTTSQAAQKATSRMTAYVAYLVSHFGIQTKRQFNHSCCSIPKSMYKDMRDPEKRKKIESKMLSELKKIGIEGGIMVYHPFRFHEGLTEPYFSPHYHFILTGWTTPEGVIQFHKKTGGITYTAFGSFGDTKRLFNSIRYVLSHCGIYQEKHAVRYFGLCHNTKFKTANIHSNACNSIDEISSYVEAMVDLNLKNVKSDLPGTFKKSTLQSLKVQEVIFENLTVSDIEKRRVIDVGTDEANLKTKLSELCLDESILQYGVVNDLDNAPKTKSDVVERSADVQCVLVSAVHNIDKMKFSLKTNSYYKEKCCTKSTVFVIIVNDSTVDLCSICNFKMKKLIPVVDSVDISKIFLVEPELDGNSPLKIGEVPDNQSFLANGSDFRYLDFTDMRDGIPYFDELDNGSIALKYDNKILHPSKFYDSYNEQSKLQFAELQDKSKKKAIERYCKNLIFSGNSTELFEDLVSNHQIVNYCIVSKAQKSLRMQVELGPIDSFV